MSQKHKFRNIYNWEKLAHTLVCSDFWGFAHLNCFIFASYSSSFGEKREKAHNTSDTSTLSQFLFLFCEKNPKTLHLSRLLVLFPDLLQ